MGYANAWVAGPADGDFQLRRRLCWLALQLVVGLAFGPRADSKGALSTDDWSRPMDQSAPARTFHPRSLVSAWHSIAPHATGSDGCDGTGGAFCLMDENYQHALRLLPNNTANPSSRQVELKSHGLKEK